MSAFTIKERFELRKVVRARGDILANYRLIFDALCDYMNLTAGDAFPSCSTLAKDTALSERTVRRGLWWLHDNGIIIVTDRIGKPALITFRHPGHSLVRGTPDTAMSEVNGSDPGQMDTPPRTQPCPDTPDTAMSDEHCSDEQSDLQVDRSDTAFASEEEYADDEIPF